MLSKENKRGGVRRYCNLNELVIRITVVKNLPVVALLFLGYALSAHGGTIFIGFKDSAGPTVDYDYNDLMFAVSSPTLKLNSGAMWAASVPALTINGADASNLGLQTAPYWNNTSFDGPKENMGWCVYGGGNCNNGVALDPGASYLTTDALSPTGSPNDVLFQSDRQVSVTLLGHNAGSTNTLSYYLASNPSNVIDLFSGDQGGITTTFQTGSSFGFFGQNEHNGQSFYTRSADGGTADQVAHFAYFASLAVAAADAASPDIMASKAILAADVTTPEPATWLLLLPALALLLKNRGR